MTDRVNRLDSISKIILLGMLIISLTNAILHNPGVGYDAGDYTAYIETLSVGQLPVAEENDEFFTPPLPFVIPALLDAIFNLRTTATLKIAQFLNVLVAFGTALVLARISNRLTRGDDISRNLALGFLLTLPVFYKTHAFVRAEPYLVLLLLLYIEQLIRLTDRSVDTTSFSVISGLLFGAAVLSRQWAILILPAVFLFALILIFRDEDRRWLLAKSFAISGLIAFIISSWFYFSLLNRYGSVSAFNREPVERFSLRNKPKSFYIGTGNGNLFTDPVRDSFDNQLLPIMYTETWGDYWVFFLVYGTDLRAGEYLEDGLLLKAFEEEGSDAWLETNRYEIAPYLGRVNLVSLGSSAIATLSFFWALLTILRRIISRKTDGVFYILILLTALTLSTILGYLWFLIQYPTLDGDTIKATYLLQVFPLISILIGLFGTRFGRTKPWFYPVAMIVFLLTMIHNLPAMITHYTS